MASATMNETPATSCLRDKIDACTAVVTKLTAEVRTMRAVAMAEGGRWLIEQGVRHRISSMRKSGGTACALCF